MILPPRAQLAFYLLIWWTTNNIFAIHTQVILDLPSSPPSLYLDITYFQIVVGLLLSNFLLRFQTPSHSKPPSLIPLPPSDFLTLLISLSHLLGATFTNASYKTIGATATLVWKLSEPLTTTLLKLIILRKATPLLSFLGLQVILAGVFLFSTSTYTIASLSPILLANIAFPVRNVALKKEQSLKQNSSSSTLYRFHTLYLHIFPIATFFFFLKYIFLGANFPDLNLLENALLFNTYQLASLAVLDNLDSLTHSITNTMKRFTGILLAALYTQDSLRLHQIFGLLLTFCGFPLYVFGQSLSLAMKKMKNPIPIKSVLVALVLAVPAVVYISVMPETSSSADAVGQQLRERFTSVTGLQFDDDTNAHVQSLASQRTAAPEYVIHIDPKYRQVPNIVVSTYEQARSIDDGDNTGNFIWQHAAYVSLPDFSGVKTCDLNRTVCHNMYVAGTSKRMVSYRPGANYFNFKRPGAFAIDIEIMEELDSVPLLLGIGVQAYFTKTSIVVDLHPGREIETIPEEFEFTERARNLLRMLQERKYPMLFRGDFTLAAAQHVGYTHGLSVGCPSLFLSEEMQLGRILEAKYRALKGRIGDKSLKVAINIKEGGRFQALFRKLLDIYPNSYVYTQGKGDMKYLESHSVPFERVRLFTNVEAWKASIGEMDVSIGARIHGNMIAVAAGVPTLVLAPDHRVLELVGRMKVPHMGFFDENVANWTDVAEVVSSVEFDGAEFDRNRCETAKIYQRVFKGYGIGVNEHVRRIAALC